MDEKELRKKLEEAEARANEFEYLSRRATAAFQEVLWKVFILFVAFLSGDLIIIMIAKGPALSLLQLSVVAFFYLGTLVELLIEVVSEIRVHLILVETTKQKYQNVGDVGDGNNPSLVTK